MTKYSYFVNSNKFLGHSFTKFVIPKIGDYLWGIFLLEWGC